MEREFIQYTEAIALKELGFDEKCLGYYIKNSSLWCNWLDVKFNDDPSNDKEDFVADAPLYQQAFRWFREKHRLSHYDIRRDYYISEDGVRSYDDIELACLKKLIEIVKEK